MNDFFSSHKKETILSAVVMTVAGFVLLFFPSATQDMIAKVLALVLIIMGIIRIVKFFTNKGVNPTTGLNEYGSPVDLVLGILMIVMAALVVKVLMSLIPIILGIMILISGIMKLTQALNIKSMGTGNWVGILVLSLITIAVGLVGIVNPFKANNILLQFIGAGLIFGGITDLISGGYMSSKNKGL